jgi:ferric-dicitrate binding protein FerR (iron transport regulator)
MKLRFHLEQRLAALAVTLIAAHAGPALAQAQSNIGVASGAKNQVEGVVSGQTQTIARGNNVFANEVVKTGVDSLAQLLFLDQTTLSVAPKSEVTLDRFVYDPSRGAGVVALRATVGAFRFVTGSQNPNSYLIETPVATISVRGTILDILVWSDHVIVIVQQGAATVTSLRTRLSYDLTTPGSAFVVWDSGRVEGPITWDSTLIRINGAVPFPLFGDTVWPGQRDLPTFDSRKTLNDLLNTEAPARSSPPVTGGFTATLTRPPVD